MKQLLSIEFSKVKNYTTFWVILSIYVACVPLLFFLISNIDFPFLPNNTELYGFPTVWGYITYSASWLNLLLGVLVVIITCNEINFKTQRQNIIDGLSRKQVILSKFYFLTALAVVVTLYTFFIGFIFGIFNSDITEMFKGTEAIGVYFIQTIGYFSFAFFFAVLVKRPALSIIFYVLIFALKFIFVIVLGETVSQFMPINVIGDLTPFPFFKEFFAMLEAQDPNVQLPYIMPQMVRSLAATGWITIFVFVSYLVLKKRDL